MRLLALSLTLALTSMSHAQTATQTTPNTPADRADWSRVQALKPGTKVLLNASTRHGSCIIQTVTADALTCASGTQAVVQRASVRVIKLPHRGRSALIGAVAAGGVGALAGATSINDGTYGFVTRGQAAVIFAVPLAIIGALVGFFSDFARTTFYRVN